MRLLLDRTFPAEHPAVTSPPRDRGNCGVRVTKPSEWRPRSPSGTEGAWIICSALRTPHGAGQPRASSHQAALGLGFPCQVPGGQSLTRLLRRGRPAGGVPLRHPTVWIQASSPGSRHSSRPPLSKMPTAGRRGRPPGTFPHLCQCCSVGIATGFLWAPHPSPRCQQLSVPFWEALVPCIGRGEGSHPPCPQAGLEQPPPRHPGCWAGVLGTAGHGASLVSTHFRSEAP